MAGSILWHCSNALTALAIDISLILFPLECRAPKSIVMMLTE
ncbi:MAG TPA: hypothetical protein VGQ99_03935 [Tepidisphaeraceae bacterium]|nr:hypothetical protein [Tepidisphaeraceae bacterium]